MSDLLCLCTVHTTVHSVVFDAAYTVAPRFLLYSVGSNSNSTTTYKQIVRELSAAHTYVTLRAAALR